MTRLRFLQCLCLCIVLGLQPLFAAGEEPTFDAKQLEFFETKIRPVLVSECYSCHSVEAEKQGKLRGELLLDSRDATLTGGESGPAIVAGNPDESLLISALKHESMEMPPKGKLSDQIISDFVKWVELGAPDPRSKTERSAAPKLDLEAGRKFWAFQPLRLDAPSAGDSLLAVAGYHPVDRFIVAKQLENNLTPSAFASPRTLVRRAWFDLLGLPPTPEQMQHWIKRLTPEDPNATDAINETAWSELIRELLNQPQYGERWARHWIDVARFAESHGYEQDYDRPTAFHYRDFLIQAFNQDLPYDRFVQWQLAGDELAPDNPLAWMATGFLGGGAFPTQLTETEFESARYDELDDMVATTGVAFLGFSVGCARCHDHKFDPIGALDYYQMAATFTNAIRTEKTFDLEPEVNRQRQVDFDARIAAARQRLKEFDETNYVETLCNHLKQNGDKPVATDSWSVLDGKLSSAQKTTFKKQDDGSYLATGATPLKDEWRLEIELPAGKYRSVRIEALSDPSLPQQGPGRGGNGNFSLTDLKLVPLDSAGTANAAPRFVDAVATFEQNNSSLSARSSIDEDPAQSGWAVDGKIGTSQAAAFRLAEDLTLDKPTRFALDLKFNHGSAHHMIGRLRVSISSNLDAAPLVSTEVFTAAEQQALKRVLALLASGSDAKQIAADAACELETLKNVCGKQMPERAQLVADIAKLESEGPGIKMTKVLVTSEGLPHLPHHADDRGFPHFYPETHLLRRGDVHQKVEVVQPGLLRVMLPENVGIEQWQLSEAERSNSLGSYRRATLARWLTDSERGAGQLVARVMVNRLRQHHFGQGIVPTPNDFGASGERPTHPELLDWLASQLIERGWSLKDLHHHIMTSRTYMQGNKKHDDPRLAIDLQNRFYWHRSPMRLEAEPIRDAMLAVSGRMDPRMYGPGTLDSNMSRRSVYFFIKRSQLIPEMMLFDWPEHLVSTGQRPSTTIAPQALMFINSPQGRAHAAALATRVKSTDVGAAIGYAYELALGRKPTARELEVSAEFIKSQTSLRREQGEQDAEGQAMADLCQAILSMNEFIYID